MKSIRLILALLIALAPLAALADPAVTTAATATNLVLYTGKGGAGTTLTVIFTNTNAATRYLQIFDAAALPADATVPKASIAVATGQTYVLNVPWSCTTGIVLCNSTTALTKTLGAADSIFTGYTTAQLHAQ